MAPTKSIKSKEQKEGAKGYEDHPMYMQSLDQSMIELTAVIQNDLDDITSHFDKLFKEMTDLQDKTARMLHGFEHMAKMDSQKVEKDRKDVVSAFIY